MTVPCLILTFATLFVYYRFFHPWKSEGISVGFAPENDEKWKILENDYDRMLKMRNDLSIRRITRINPAKRSTWKLSNLHKGKYLFSIFKCS